MPATPRIQNQRPSPDLPTMCVVRTGQDYGSTHPIRRVDDDDDDTTITTRNNLGMKQQSEQTLQRHLSLFDLVAVGIGATVGSGVFVLTGFVAHALSGPAVSCSWLVAGLAACLSGSCYAELGGRYPCVGSTYVYAKETMGTYASVVAAACLTLEYIGRWVLLEQKQTNHFAHYILATRMFMLGKSGYMEHFVFSRVYMNAK